MFRRIFLLLLLLVSGYNSICYANDSTLRHTESWQAVLSEAKQHNKLIFVDCYFTGCHPCAQMDKEVFPVDVVSKTLENRYVAVKVDVFKEKLGDTVNLKYVVTGFPTFLILSPEGKLLDRFSGFTDAAALLEHLKDSEANHLQGKYLSGFTTNLNPDYPLFYRRYFDRKSEPLPPSTAIEWLEKQDDLLKEEVAASIFMTRKLSPALENRFVAQNESFRIKYGSAFTIPKLENILSSRLKPAVNNQQNELVFRNFLNECEKLVNTQDWRVVRFMLGYNYYLNIAKDHTGFLRFANVDPLLYANYMGALYSQLIAAKLLSATNLALLCSWADKAINETAPFEAMNMAASWFNQNGDKAGQQRFLQMAVNRAVKYGISPEKYEQRLAAN